MKDFLDMEELIPSPDVREAMQREGTRFSDEELVSLIINNALGEERKCLYLALLANEMGDGKLKEKVIQYIRCTAKEVEQFTLNEPDVVFLLKIDDEEDMVEAGYFYKYEDAFAYGAKSGRNIRIEKYPVFRNEKAHMDPRDADGDIWGEDWLGQIWFDSSGRIQVCDSHELTEEERSYDDCIAEVYVPFPDPFDRGDIVRVIYDSGTPYKRVGIITETREEHEALGERGACFDDGMILMDTVHESGRVSFDHVMLPELTRAEMDAETSYGAMVLEMSKVIRNGGSLYNFVGRFQEYGGHMLKAESLYYA